MTRSNCHHSISSPLSFHSHSGVAGLEETVSSYRQETAVDMRRDGGIRPGEDDDIDSHVLCAYVVVRWSYN